MTEEFLVYKSTIFINSDWTFTYYSGKANGSNQEEITEDEYINIADTKFTDLDKKSANILWVTKTIEEINAMDEAAVYEMLKASYEGFSLK